MNSSRLGADNTTGEKFENLYEDAKRRKER